MTTATPTAEPTVDADTVRTWLLQPSDTDPDLTVAESLGADWLGEDTDDGAQPARMVETLHAAQQASVLSLPGRVLLWITASSALDIDGFLLTVDLPTGGRVASDRLSERDLLPDPFTAGTVDTVTHYLRAVGDRAWQMMRAAGLDTCVLCGGLTTNTQQADDGWDGSVCVDCADWCDGDLSWAPETEAAVEPVPMDSPDGLAVLRTADVARIFSAAAGRPIAPGTVRRYLHLSRNGRYQDNPMPMPLGEPKVGAHIVWVPDEGETVDELAARLRAWWHSRPGLDHGRGGPKAAATRG